MMPSGACWLGVEGAAPLALGVAGVALIVVGWGAGAAARRISALHHSVSALERGDLSARAETVAGEMDEITRLEQAFNSMADRIQMSHRELERQVAEKTTELLQQKESAQALRQSTEQERAELERHLLYTQKLESLGVLAGGVAHDFNNLLMAISGNLELLRQLAGAGNPGLKYVDNALGAAKRAADLTSQMLAYSCKRGNSVALVDLNRLVGESVELMKASMGKGLILSVRLRPALPMLEAEPGQIQQVIRNLITNAIEAIGEGPGTISVATGVAEFLAAALAQSSLERKPSPGQYLFVEVADSGCGMDRETRERMFDLFFTTKFTGRGLGLSAVTGIITGHRGAVLVESAPGEGTRVTVLFPAPLQQGEPRELTGHRD